MLRDDYTIHINVDGIIIGDRREVDPKTVKYLTASIKEVGLQHPITVRKVGDDVHLVAGRHRLEAVKATGAQTIQAHVVRWSKDRARMWEISENLHRAELSRIERAEQIEEWRALKAKGAQLAHPSANAQPHDVGVSATAEELGVSRREVERAREIASISDEAKEAAKEAGFAEKQSVLLEIAARPNDEQVAAVAEIAAARALKTEQDIKNRAAQDVAELFATHIPPDVWDMLKASIKTADNVNLILAAFNNLVGNSIMDRRHG